MVEVNGGDRQIERSLCKLNLISPSLVLFGYRFYDGGTWLLMLSKQSESYHP